MRMKYLYPIMKQCASSNTSQIAIALIRSGIKGRNTQSTTWRIALNLWNRWHFIRLEMHAARSCTAPSWRRVRRGHHVCIHIHISARARPAADAGEFPGSIRSKPRFNPSNRLFKYPSADPRIRWASDGGLQRSPSSRYRLIAPFTGNYLRARGTAASFAWRIGVYSLSLSVFLSTTCFTSSSLSLYLSTCPHLR